MDRTEKLKESYNTENTRIYVENSQRRKTMNQKNTTM